MRFPQRQSCRFPDVQGRDDDSTTTRMPRLHVSLYDLRADRANGAPGSKKGWEPGSHQSGEAVQGPCQSLRKAASVDGSLGSGSGRNSSRPPQGPYLRGPLQPHRSRGYGQASPDRPSGLCRYVSVYRQFDNVGEFISEIQSLENRAMRDHMQRRLFKE